LFLFLIDLHEKLMAEENRGLEMDEECLGDCGGGGGGDGGIEPSASTDEEIGEEDADTIGIFVFFRG
jgi:hypothetical protein